MRIAVTGASGFVGGHVVRALAARGHRVSSYGRRPRATLRFDLPNYQTWDIGAGPIRAAEVDVVVHCAAHVGDWGDERHYRAVNVDGTRTVLETFAGVERFVHVSTTSVYSDHVAVQLVREDAPTGDCAHSAYARTKAEAERVMLASGRSVAVLRPHIVYGPDDTTLLPRLLAARRRGRLLVPGTGENRVSATHVDNLAHAVTCAAERSAHGVFNVADAESPTVHELLTTVFARLGMPTSIGYLPRRVAWGMAVGFERVWRAARAASAPPLTRYAVAQLADEHTLDIQRARTVLGYTPRWSYRDGPLGKT